MERKEKRIEYLANRWIEDKFLNGIPVKMSFEARNIQTPEDIYLANVIPAADTIKQAEAFPVLEDQIIF